MMMMMIFVINVFRRQGCPHLGQGHGPIVSSRHENIIGGLFTPININMVSFKMVIFYRFSLNSSSVLLFLYEVIISFDLNSY